MSKIINYINLRIYLIKASIKNTFQIETAYSFNTLLSFFGVVVFISAQIVFTEVVFFNVETLGNVTKDGMLLFFLIGQISFFINGALVSRNMYQLVDGVNNGNLDLVLIRPIPSLFYVSLKELSILTIVRDGILPSMIFVYVIDWAQIVTSPLQIIIALAIFVIGQYLLHFMQFLAAIPVFFLGQSSNLIDFSYVFDYRLGRMIPFDVLGPTLKIFFTTVVPVLVASGITLSVILGNSDPLPTLGVVSLIAAVLFVIENWVWGRMLRIYTSASS